jgi:ArsR family transcriptional regulator, arsenate/arsenite/antimonite-responsive transcriptional repressor
MSRTTTEKTLETLFKALADRTRLRILGLLVAGEVCVCDIHESLKIPQPKASRHLAYLRRAGLVEARKKGLWVHYRLAPAADAVRGAVVDAVGHALGHVPAVGRDRQRLETRTGCCAWPAIVGPNFSSVRHDRSATFSCCEPSTPLTAELVETTKGEDS